MTVTYRADVVIAGGGLAGLATAHELLDRGRRVLILDRDTEDRLGGLAKRSFGGVMFVDTPHQRKLGINDNPELAWSDWQSFADFGDDDEWPRRWARAYVERSTELIFDWLTGHRRRVPAGRQLGRTRSLPPGQLGSSLAHRLGHRLSPSSRPWSPRSTAIPTATGSKSASATGSSACSSKPGGWSAAPGRSKTRTANSRPAPSTWCWLPAASAAATSAR